MLPTPSLSPNIYCGSGFLILFLTGSTSFCMDGLRQDGSSSVRYIDLVDIML